MATVVSRRRQLACRPRDPERLNVRTARTTKIRYSAASTHGCAASSTYAARARDRLAGTGRAPPARTTVPGAPAVTCRVRGSTAVGSSGHAKRWPRPPAHHRVVRRARPTASLEELVDELGTAARNARLTPAPFAVCAVWNRCRWAADRWVDESVRTPDIGIALVATLPGATLDQPQGSGWAQGLPGCTPHRR
jgi:hypothetical protein